MTTSASADVVVARHWRPEVADVARALRRAGRDRPRPVAVAGGGRWPRPETWRHRPAVVVVSDTAAVPRGATVTRWRGAKVARLWWNGPDEVLSHLADHPEACHETHICFFPEVAQGLAGHDLDVVEVPYAFAPVLEATPPDEVAVGYVGEIDVGPGCFERLGGADPTALASRADGFADQVATGERSLVDVTTEIQRADHLDAPMRTAVVWSMRNRLRRLLIDAIAAEFGPQLRLVGDDWRALGYPADPTDFDRRRRVARYQAHRVSLDLGSKSTDSVVYPRSAEILGCAGGLVQFNPGTEVPATLAGLEQRQVHDAPALVAEVGRLLDSPVDELAASNLALQARYAALQAATADRLLDALLART